LFLRTVAKDSKLASLWLKEPSTALSFLSPVNLEMTPGLFLKTAGSDSKLAFFWLIEPSRRLINFLEPQHHIMPFAPHLSHKNV
jgi:hypothetical protein